MERKDLISSPVYWAESFRLKLYRLLVDYQEKHNNCSLKTLCEDLNIDNKILIDYLMKDKDSITLFDFIDITLKLGGTPELFFYESK